MSIKRVGKYKFKDYKRKFKAEKQKLPLILANIAINHFKKGFRTGGGQTNDSLSGWAARKVADTGRAILVKSGDLLRSIKKQIVTFSKIQIGTTGIKYARRHNEGLEGMTKREFIGDSNILVKLLKEKIISRTNKVYK